MYNERYIIKFGEFYIIDFKCDINSYETNFIESFKIVNKKDLKNHYYEEYNKEMVLKIMDTLISLGFDSSKLLAIDAKEVENV